MDASKPKQDYNEYISTRRQVFDILCGVLKNKKPEVKKIMGMMRDTQVFSDKRNLHECTIFNCIDWSKEKYEYYNDLYKDIGLKFWG